MIFSAPEAAEYLNQNGVIINSRGLRRRLNLGQIRGKYLGLAWAIDKTELDRYIKNRQK